MRQQSGIQAQNPVKGEPIIWGGVLQRKCACGKHITNQYDECTECHKKRTRLQRIAVNRHQPETAPPIVHNVLRSPGQPLDPATRAFMETRFGHDFSQVRVHTDEKAAQSARTVRAHAYTVGQRIVFDAGKYAPRSTEGQKLLAHELAHVVQQDSANQSTPIVLPVTKSTHTSEFEAETAARRVAKLQPVTQARQNTTLARQQADDMRVESDSCGVQLCFLPLHALLEAGVSPDLAYAAAVHAFLRWNGQSAGFTRLEGETIGDARVITPEPRSGEPHERCVQARLRTVPTPTPGQLTSFTPIGLTSDIISYGSDLVQGLTYCRNPSCEQAQARINHLLTDNRRGLYDLYDENCETWARNVLAAACMEAPELHLGGYGNILQRILRETPFGNIYHAARLLTGRTRPLPQTE